MVENNMSLYATGGAITNVSNKRIHTFTTAGTDTFTVISGVTAEVLIVAGGGGGGQSGNPNEGAAGGGAGGLVYVSSTTLSAGSYTITVGAGGGVGSAGGNNNGINGGNSSFSTIYVGLGGGGGGAHDLNGSSGGSGGGAGGTNVVTSPGSATQPGSGGFGNAGGGNYTGPNYAGGGGGGAGAAGGPAIATVAPASGGGTGGIGRAYSISGTTTYYAGGGGGGDKQTNSAAGGLGGGGTGGKASAVGQPGTPNTGGGGGGAASSGIGAGIGGSGIVIISYTVASVSFISLSSTQATVAVSPGTAIPGALYRIIAYNPEGAASNPVTFSITNSLSGSGPAFLNPGPQTFVGGGSFVINQTAASSGITWTRSPTTGVTLINPLDSGVNVTVSDGIPIASPTNYTITATDSAAQATSQIFTIQNTFTAPAFVNPGVQSFTNGGSFSVTQTAANTGQLGWSISPTTGMTLSSASTSGVTVTVSAGQAISGVTYALTAVNPTPTSCVQSFSVTNTVTALYSFTTFTFTPIGATGSYGPTSLAGYGTSYPGYGTAYALTLTGGIQYWTVPITRSYTFTLAGAGVQHLNTASSPPYAVNYISYGVVGTSTLALTAGHVLRILVGQQGTRGQSGTFARCGGCGGSFVYNQTTATLLLSVGGGGGHGGDPGGATLGAGTPYDPYRNGTGKGDDGQIGTSGSVGRDGNGGTAGVNGAGGGANTQGYGGDGGAGFIGNGNVNTANGNSVTVAKSFINGGTGAIGGNSPGGFGGGGSGGSNGGAGAGGGGGYSGGGGGANQGNGEGGGGGGSYTVGTLTSISATNLGMGYVTIT